MTAPVRLQLSRKKGFDLQALSMATNGLPAVNVTRLRGSAGMWGNWPAKRIGKPEGKAAVQAFRTWIETEASYAWRGRAAIDLRNKNLACWCAPSAPCHADVLLEIANSPTATMEPEP